MGKKIYAFIFGILLVIGLIVVVMQNGKSDSSPLIGDLGKVDYYASASCGCCSVYSGYLKNKGFSLNIIRDDNGNAKARYGVPAAMESCHTYVVGDYFVEGHIPIEAVNKLLEEKPNIAGIAMPGMPSGSPGMPGAKKGDFVIYAVNKDGTYNEFMRI